MRIVHVGPVGSIAVQPTGTGGIEKAVYFIARYQGELDHDVRIIDIRADVHKNLTPKIKFHEVWVPPLKDMGAIRHLIRVAFFCADDINPAAIEPREEDRYYPHPPPVPRSRRLAGQETVAVENTSHPYRAQSLDTVYGLRSPTGQYLRVLGFKEGRPCYHAHGLHTPEVDIAVRHHALANIQSLLWYQHGRHHELY